MYVCDGCVGVGTAQHAANTLDMEDVELVTNLLTVTCGDREAVPAVPM